MTNPETIDGQPDAGLEWAKQNQDACRAMSLRYGSWWHFGLLSRERYSCDRLADEWTLLMETRRKVLELANAG